MMPKWIKLSKKNWPRQKPVFTTSAPIGAIYWGEVFFSENTGEFYIQDGWGTKKAEWFHDASDLTDALMDEIDKILMDNKD